MLLKFDSLKRELKLFRQNLLMLFGNLATPELSYCPAQLAPKHCKKIKRQRGRREGRKENGENGEIGDNKRVGECVVEDI